MQVVVIQDLVQKIQVHWVRSSWSRVVLLVIDKHKTADDDDDDDDEHLEEISPEALGG